VWLAESGALVLGGLGRERERDSGEGLQLRMNGSVKTGGTTLLEVEGTDDREGEEGWMAFGRWEV
jgi:hypothetical protein